MAPIKIFFLLGVGWIAIRPLKWIKSWVSRMGKSVSFNDIPKFSNSCLDKILFYFPRLSNRKGDHCNRCNLTDLRDRALCIANYSASITLQSSFNIQANILVGWAPKPDSWTIKTKEKTGKRYFCLSLPPNLIVILNRSNFFSILCKFKEFRMLLFFCKNLWLFETEQPWGQQTDQDDALFAYIRICE